MPSDRIGRAVCKNAPLIFSAVEVISKRDSIRHYVPTALNYLINIQKYPTFIDLRTRDQFHTGASGSPARGGKNFRAGTITDCDLKRRKRIIERRDRGKQNQQTERAQYEWRVIISGYQMIIPLAILLNERQNVNTPARYLRLATASCSSREENVYAI